MITPLHICFIVYSYEKKLQEIDHFLSAYYSLTGWCDALVAQGCKVTVLSRFYKEGYISRNTVDYYFLSDSYRQQLRPWQIPFKLHKKAKTINATVYHGHNMDKALQHAHLKYTLGKDKRLLIQNHAETPKNALRIQLQKYLLKHIDAFLFCAKGQEKTWQEHKIIHPSSQIFYVMEASTHFQNMAKTKAQLFSNISGDPVFLWVGNLNANKDPLTILAAFDSILTTNPNAQLYMIYRFDDLLTEVKNYIHQQKSLKDNVHLLGAMPQEKLEIYYNSADYFILGSHHEGSGYSLMESMACGCIPIVTNIDSFRMMTDNGRIGFLWNVGDIPNLIRAINEALLVDKAHQSLLARTFFDQKLSYKAIGKKMLAHYLVIS